MVVTGAPEHPFSLRGHVALVTGSGRGLGFAIARSLAAAGADVLLNGRDPQRLARAVDALLREGLKVAPLAFDVAEEGEVARAFERIGCDRGHLDILVGNVGARHRAPLADLSVAAFRGLLEIDLTAGFSLAKAALPLMVPRRRGRIIMITSIAGPLARAGDAAYTAAKGGLGALTRALAVELGPEGVTVNAIAPGFFATETNAALVGDAGTQVFLERRCPLRRWGEAHEIGGAAVFLASEAASYVNGIVLTVDGGLSATLYP